MAAIFDLSPRCLKNILLSATCTLAVPRYCAEGGLLRRCPDSVKFGGKLDWECYGSEAGYGGTGGRCVNGSGV